MDLPARKLSPDDALSKLLPAPVAVPLAGLEILTVEDLYDMIASLGAGWFREVEGLDAQGAATIVSWLADFGRDVGEVTERFYPAGFAPDADRTDESDYGIVPLERLTLTSVELGEGAINRAPAVGCSLEARDDLEALKQWLGNRNLRPDAPRIPTPAGTTARKPNAISSGACANAEPPFRPCARVTPRSIFAGWNPSGARTNQSGRRPGRSHRALGSRPRTRPARAPAGVPSTGRSPS